VGDVSGTRGHRAKSLNLTLIQTDECLEAVDRRALAIS
jgi:hypothetical protein